MAVHASRDLTLNLHERRDGNALLQAANDLDKLGRGMDAAGDKAHAFTDDVKGLNQELDVTKKRIHDLHVQFARTRDQSIFGDIAKEERNLRRLQKVLRELTPDGPGGPGGFPNIGDMLGKIPTRWGAIGGGILGAVGPGPISPFLGASLGGLLSGAIGTAGLAAGILSAAKDPQVISAAKAFGASVSKEFFSGGDVFINPIREGLGILDKAVKDLNLPETFGKLAPVLTTIAGGFADFARNIMPGVNAAFDRMGPFADVAAEGIAELGSALGTFIDEVTASEGAVMGLDAIFKFINATIVLTGRGIHMLSDVFATLVRTLPPFITNLPLVGDMFRDIMVTTSQAPEKVDPFIEGLNEIDESAVGVHKAVQDADKALESFLNEIQKLIPEAFSLEEAQDSAATQLQRLNEQIQEQIENGEEGAASLNGFSEAAIANRGAVRDLVTIYGDLITRAALAGEDTDALKESLRTQLIQMGLMPAEVQRYIDQLDRIPAEKITKVALENAEALAKAQETDRELNRLLRDRNVNVTLTAWQAFRTGERTGLREFDSGGFTNWPRNEARLAVLHGQERVLTPEEQYAMAMGGQQATAMEMRFSGDADSAVATMIMKLIRQGKITISPQAVR